MNAMRHKLIFGAVTLAGALFAGGSLSASTQAAPSRLTGDDVATALTAIGLEVTAAQITVPDLPLRTAHPPLDVMHIETLDAESSRVLVRCSDRVSCIPFYATVRGLPASTVITRAGAPVTAAPVAARKNVAPPLVRRGSLATLELVTANMLVTLPVICQQDGRQGQQIRVSSTDRKRTYTASVIGAERLRGAL